MRLPSLLIIGFAAVTVGATALAWRQYQELVVLRAQGGPSDRQRLEQQLAELRAQNRALLAQLAHAAEKNGGSNTTGTEGEEGAANAANAAATVATLASANAESRKDAELEVLAALADTPEFQRLVALQQRGAIDGKYAALFHKLHLSPEQQQQLEAMLGEKQTAYADALLAARDQGLSGRDARVAAKEVAQATGKEIDAQIKAMLGDQGYQQYQNYERTMPQRETVSQLAQRLTATDAPLTAHQQEQLVQALAAGARQDIAALRAQAAATGQPVARPPATMNALPNGLSNLGVSAAGGAVITPGGVTKAQSILSAQQLSTLQQLQQEQQAQLALSQLLRNRATKTVAPKPTAAPAPAPAKNGKG